MSEKSHVRESVCAVFYQKCLIFLFTAQNNQFLHFFRDINLCICKKSSNFAAAFLAHKFIVPEEKKKYFKNKII